MHPRMTKPSALQSIDRASRTGLASPVERLVLVDELERKRTGPFQSQSLPGHLLHIVVSGSVSQWAEGRAEAFGAGSVVWYHENEPVRGRILRAPWRFITINFHAPAILPPPDDQRVLQGGADSLRLARKLLALWRDVGQPPLNRQLCCHQTLLELLVEILRQSTGRSVPQPEMKIWWPIEKKLRARLEEPVTLDIIQRLSGFSLRTIIRACRAVTGLPPLKRFKEIRLGYARGLVQHSDLAITEIAFRVGYPRSQEFSRDYRRRFGLTAREDRRHAPNYREWEQPAAR